MKNRKVVLIGFMTQLLMPKYKIKCLYLITKSKPTFTGEAIQAMRDGNILEPNETPEEMVERIIQTIWSTEKAHFPRAIGKPIFLTEFRARVLARIIVPGTPIMANANRPGKVLAACSIPPVDLRADQWKIMNLLTDFQRDGMGLGLLMDEATDPIKTLLYFNEQSVKHQKEGHFSRKVGNMAVMSVSDPRILKFISVKQDHPEVDWVFCITVNIDDEFMRAVIKGKRYKLRDRTKVDARKLFNKIVDAAWKTGEPGLVFLERLERQSALRQKIECVPPCGEIGLAKGETCQFMALNVAECIAKDGLDYKLIARTVQLMVRALDDVVEHNSRNHRYKKSKEMAAYSRKIGIGVCGFSDALIRMNIPFASKRAVELAEELLSFINYTSKLASMELAKERGPFSGFKDSEYFKRPGFLARRFGRWATRLVSKEDWTRLDQQIARFGIRNATTVVLPPTGRSALMFDTSRQIEPIFCLYDMNGFNRHVVAHLEERYSSKILEKALKEIREKGSIQRVKGISKETKELLRTSIEIPYQQHLAVLQAAQRFTDGAVSKTVNLPKNTSRETIKRIFLMAYRKGLNGITVYRDGSRKGQPINLR